MYLNFFYELNISIKKNNFTFIPSGRFDIGHTILGSYKQSGLGAIDVQKQHVRSKKIRTGLAVVEDLSSGDYTFKRHGKLEYVANIDRSSDFKYTYVSDGSTKFNETLHTGSLHNLNGEIALNWIVSRNTEILDGKKIVNENGEDISSWKPMPGVSDLTRIKKQQQLVLAMMGKINNFESFNNFLNFVNALEDTFTIDNNISTIEASSLLWDFRDFNFDNVKKLTVPTYNYKTEGGAEVLILDDNFYNFIQSNNLLD